jgi:DNA-binding CsgD family transcriptional regulator/ketosteroid isomerase-like protein
MSMEATTLDRWFDAFNAHDLAAMAAVADPDIEIFPLGLAVTTPAGTVYRGHDGMRSLMKPGFERYPGVQIETGAYETVGAQTVVPVTFVFHDGSGSSPPRRKSTSVFRFRDGLVRRLHAFDMWGEARAYAERSSEFVLTPREREVMSHLATGLNAEEVARSLVISPFTVRTHVRNAKEKLGARTMAHAIAIVLRDGEGPQTNVSSS